MTEDDSLRLVQTVLVAILVVSALISRRLPMRQVFRLALAWLAIFGLIFIIFGYRHRIVSEWYRLGLSWNLTEQRLASDGKSVVLQRSPDGHFWADVRINSAALRMMIDSGASITAISERSRRDLGLKKDRGFGTYVETANGSVPVERVTLEELAIESIVVQNIGAVTSPNFGDINVLGMNFLDRLESWSVSGGEMTLRP